MADPLEKFAVAREKNFVKQNILRAKRSYPAEPKQRSVDTRHGDAYDLKRSGLVPIYVHKKVRVSRVRKKAILAVRFRSFVLLFAVLDNCFWLLSTPR